MARIRAKKGSIDYKSDTPYLIMKNETIAEQSREYTALRDIMQKRFKRMEQAGVADKSDVYQAWHNSTYNGIPKLSDVKKNGKTLPYLLSALKRDVNKESATVKGTKDYTRKRIKGLHDAGFNFVNEKNIADFGKFMEMFRAQKLDNVIGSPEIAEIYGHVRQSFTKQQILQEWQYFKQHIDDLDDIDPSKMKNDINKLRVQKGKKARLWKN